MRKFNLRGTVIQRMKGIEREEPKTGSEQTEENPSVSLTAAFCVLLIVGMRLWFRRYTLRTVDRREREMFREGPPEVTVRIYDDRIESSGAGGKTDTPISSFKRVFRTQTLLVPLTKGNLMYLLPTDAFIKGTAEECVRFFAAKGVKVS